LRPARRLDPYLMVAPTLILLGVFFVYPIAVSARESLYRWDLLTPRVFVGADNYRALLERGEIWRSARVTLVYAVLVVLGSSSLGLGLAVLLNRPGQLAAIARGAVFSAYVLSWVAVALLFMSLLDADSGPLARASGALGLRRANWLGDPDLALLTLAAVSVWKIAGYAMVVFLAGLQDIAPSLYEAAALEGAGALTCFWRITWPLLARSAAFVATTSLIMSFQAFDVVRIMTQGGPAHATELFVYAIYEQIFMNLRVGRASALVMVYGVLILGLSALQLWAWGKRATE
jgi:ABC-type sugar transport system permease subunit